MKTIVPNDTTKLEGKSYQVLVFETLNLSDVRDPEERARRAKYPPKRMPSFSVVAPTEDAAKAAIRERFARQNRHIRSIAHAEPTSVASHMVPQAPLVSTSVRHGSRVTIPKAQIHEGAFVVYVEPPDQPQQHVRRK